MFCMAGQFETLLRNKKKFEIVQLPKKDVLDDIWQFI